MKVGAVIAAGGRGERMMKSQDKLLLPLGGKPVITITLTAFQKCPEVEEIILVANQPLREWFESEKFNRQEFPKIKRLVPGGIRRQDSVLNGLLSFDVAPLIALIHDGDRPFINVSLISKVVKESAGGGAVAAVRAQDTIKEVDEGGDIVKTLDRDVIWLAQTPQGFPYEVILAAHQRAREEGWEATDDASLVERFGGKVRIVEGDGDNIKITTPADWARAQCIYRKLRGAGGSE